MFVATFMPSYAHHVMDGQAIAIYFIILAYDDVLHAFFTHLLGELGRR